MVSIGLPLYSGGTNLADAIESILSQDYEDIELIISDHGSDPFVREVCLHYQRMDGRLKYYPTGDHTNYVGIYNLARMIELSHAPYFIWGSYDDRMEKSFISSCLKVMEGDDTIALVYPRSKVFNGKGEFVGLGADSLKADSDDPFDRFIHVIWELQMCNAFYGLFRRCYMRKTRALYKNCYAHDNLFLAEIALLGKIIQINDVLFIRCLTRNYNLRLDEHHADVLHSADPIYLEEGLTLPFCRFTYAHCELVNHSSLPPERKESLTQEILRCFKRRWAMQLNYEINRLIHFLKNGVYYQTWDGRTYNHDLRKRTPNLHYFHVTDVLKSIREALFIFPEHQELQKIYEASIGNIQIPERTVIIPTQVHQEVT
jgi:glycosyltransferase involved in cell wall biosynthesis